jgi:ABC-type oligopeptide transport system ATPase subunit
MSNKRRIAVLGLSGAGKTTIGQMITDIVGDAACMISFAEPLKAFAGKVFDFTHDQLWGPTESRNAPDPRFQGEARVETIKTVQHNYETHRDAWLNDVLPPNVDRNLAAANLDVWFVQTILREPLTPRYVLQTLGTDWGRKTHDRVWSLRGVRVANLVLENGYPYDSPRYSTPCNVVVVSDLRFLNEAEDWTTAGGEIWLVERPGLDEGITGSAGVAKHVSEEEQKNPEMKRFISQVIVNDGTLDELRKKIAQLLQGVIQRGGASPR